MTGKILNDILAQHFYSEFKVILSLANNLYSKI